MTAQHLHGDDYPEALRILDALDTPRHRLVGHGYDRSGDGAMVDWQTLDGSFLSTTEKAAVLLAHGVASLERHGGGLSGDVRVAIIRAVEEAT